ncbi:FAD-binding oxidoreductase [Catelliglobosispora koreensis]|uniref:FAD-binding oxidoreductase n=1 Tax=Catelliglobosispora koreensis TaxID=129052 RepID=UPI00036139B8|nr:FAD-binding oxidoreductase [Catelliglobosispora koreensis]
MRKRSWWGWGWDDQAVVGKDLDDLAQRVSQYLPLDGHVTPVPVLDGLPKPALPQPPVESRGDTEARAAHTHGKAFRDVVRNLNADLKRPPEWVIYPQHEEDITRVFEWAIANNAKVIPFGGGSSVTGGIEYRGDEPFVSLDLSALDGVLDIDEVNLAVRAQGGIFGPALEAQLKPHELTLRHYPQSFEFSTFGGWIATRAGGHYATGYTHIDDLVQSVRIVTPSGVSEAQRVPANGAGPEPDRMWLGSEGSFGVISEAWARVQRRPTFKSSASITFSGYSESVAAVKEIAQSGLNPANCRLLDPIEAMLNTATPSATLILGFESADHPVDTALGRAVEICHGHGGEVSTKDEAGQWRGAFLKAPYLRDGLVRLGVVVETFETACLWSGFQQLHEAIVEALSPALVTCRFTHVYPDGPAPYFTVYAAGQRGGELELWDDLKARASHVLLAHGATITHHHAVGRDHLPWYRPSPPFLAAMRAVKQTLDPHNILNPGVLHL